MEEPLLWEKPKDFLVTMTNWKNWILNKNQVRVLNRHLGHLLLQVVKEMKK